MVKFDSAIDQLIPVLRKEKNLPGPDFVKSILVAFNDFAALDNIEDCSRKSDPTSIKNFLMVYTATENFVSDFAKLTEEASPLKAVCAAEKSIPVVTPILSVLPVSAAAATAFVPAAAAAAVAKIRTNVACFNCNKEGHTLYRCTTPCQLTCCPRVAILERHGRSSIPVRAAKSCPCRRDRTKIAAFIRSNLVGRSAVPHSRNPSAPSLPLSVQTQRTYLAAARSSETSVEPASKLNVAASINIFPAVKTKLNYPRSN